MTFSDSNFLAITIGSYCNSRKVKNVHSQLNSEQIRDWNNFASLGHNYISFGQSVKVLQPFKDFASFRSVNLGRFESKSKTVGQVRF